MFDIATRPAPPIAPSDSFDPETGDPVTDPGSTALTMPFDWRLTVALSHFEEPEGEPT